mgnify:CR=1 FL=1
METIPEVRPVAKPISQRAPDVVVARKVATSSRNAMGIISELMATFCRRHIFGYSFIAFSSIAIALLALASSVVVLPAASVADQQTLTQTDTAIIEMKVGKIGFLIGEGLDRRRAGIARGGAHDDDLAMLALQDIVQQAAQQLQGEVLERQGRAVKQFKGVRPVVQLRDLERKIKGRPDHLAQHAGLDLVADQDACAGHAYHACFGGRRPQRVSCQQRRQLQHPDHSEKNN